MKRKLLPMFVIYLAVLSGFLLLTILGNHAVTVIAQNQPLQRQHVIIIDAGHGGIDGGATSCTGVLESQINLDIALRLNDLMHFIGLDTVMVRTTDVSVYTQGTTIASQKMSDLKERVRLVNSFKNSILISIHQNTFYDSRYSGAQVFCANSESSRELAQTIQVTLIKTLNPTSRRQIKQGEGIYLLEHIQNPGILIECGFLSNPTEEAKLCSPEYQQKLCCVIAVTTVNYLANT